LCKQHVWIRAKREEKKSDLTFKMWSNLQGTGDLAATAMATATVVLVAMVDR
jgi:hypothetical protein